MTPNPARGQDIFSPQLYTTGTEGSPEFAQSHCSIGAPTKGNSKPMATNLYDEDKRAQREKARLAKEEDRLFKEKEPRGGYPTGCTWERLKPMKARWIPSLASEEHYPATKEFFANIGIETHGFIQWGADKSKVPDPAA